MINRKKSEVHKLDDMERACCRSLPRSPTHCLSFSVSLFLLIFFLFSSSVPPFFVPRCTSTIDHTSAFVTRLPPSPETNAIINLPFRSFQSPRVIRFRSDRNCLWLWPRRARVNFDFKNHKKSPLRRNLRWWYKLIYRLFYFTRFFLLFLFFYFPLFL